MIKINLSNKDALNKEALAEEFAKRIMASVQNSNHYKEWSKKQEVRKHINQLNERVEAIYKSPQASYNEAIKALKEFLSNHKFKENYPIKTNVKGEKVKGEEKNITIMDIYFDYEGTINKSIPDGQSLEEKRSHAIWLIHQLGITVCPYCNHDYIFTRDIEGGSGRCHLDHHIPQTKQPFLALSFYNLIPSCGVCNVLKKNLSSRFKKRRNGANEL